MTALESARKRWLGEKSEYESFGREIKKRLEGELQRAGIWAQVNSRAKEMDSLIRKLIKKPNHTYESIGDKCGTRIILRYKYEVEQILMLVATLFDCGTPEQKADVLRFDQVGYLSTHVDVKLHTDDPLAASYPPDKFRAELQVRTLAQHLWSEMAHDTFYKNDDTLNPLPASTKRRIYILAGVVELADDEFDRLNSEAPPLPEIHLLKSLERHYFKHTTRRGDSESSLDVIRLLMPLYSKDPREIALHLDEFYTEREDVIRHVYEEAANLPDRSAYLYQPEALMIYDCLNTDPVGIRKVWNECYPERELERIANAFGISFD